MYQREAMWIAFDGAFWKPNAVKVGVGGINAVSGKPLDTMLRAKPQDAGVAMGLGAGGRMRQAIYADRSEELASVRSIEEIDAARQHSSAPEAPLM